MRGVRNGFSPNWCLTVKMNYEDAQWLMYEFLKRFSYLIRFKDIAMVLLDIFL